MDPVLIFLIIGFAIIGFAVFVGRFFKKTVTKPMPGQRDGTGIGVDIAHSGKAKGWFDGSDGGDGGGGGD